MYICAIYESRDPELTRATLKVIISSVVYEKSLNKGFNYIEDTFDIEWLWGCTECPIYYGRHLSIPFGTGVVAIVEGIGNELHIRSIDGELETISSNSYGLRAKVVECDKPFIIEGDPACVAACGNKLYENTVPARVVVEECNPSECDTIEQNISLFSVCPSTMSPRIDIYPVV